MIKDKFEKNDRPLGIIKVIVEVIFIILMAFGFLFGVVIATFESVINGVFICLISLLFFGLVLLINEVIFSFMKDVKYIRDKLYENKLREEFLSAYNKTYNNTIYRDDKAKDDIKAEEAAVKDNNGELASDILKETSQKKQNSPVTDNRQTVSEATKTKPREENKYKSMDELFSEHSSSSAKNNAINKLFDNEKENK